MNINLLNSLSYYKISLKTSQINLFEKFLSLFMEKNSKINLSAIRDETGVIEKHFIDSIILNNFIELNGKVLDIGTGGGFPCIPLAITNERTQFIGLDSTRKKIDSVNEFVDKLGLINIRGVWGRAEEIVKYEEYFQQFDFVISRATAYLPDIINYSWSFLKAGGTMIFYKLYDEKEISDGKKLLTRYGIKKFKTIKYILSGQERIFIIIKK